jgi:hypothetical protein
VIDLLVSRHLHSSLDGVLRRRAVTVAQLAASAPAVLTTPGALDSPVGGTDLSVEVVDRRRRFVARSLALGGRVLPAKRLVQQAIGANRSGYANVGSSYGGLERGAERPQASLPQSPLGSEAEYPLLARLYRVPVAGQAGEPERGDVRAAAQERALTWGENGEVLRLSMCRRLIPRISLLR